MEKEKKRRIGIVSALGLVILGLTAFIIYRLVDWDSRSITVVTDDIEEGEFDIEVQDMYFYPPEGDFPNHIEDDVEDILILGNAYANNHGKKHSIINTLKDNLDAKFYDLSIDNSRISCEGPGIVYGRDASSLYHIVWELDQKDVSYLQCSAWAEMFSDEDRYYEMLDTFKTVDLNKIDTVMIMYNLIDYYNGKAALAISEDDVRGVRGSLEQSLALLQKNYPH
jgi:hypothetical protein